MFHQFIGENEMADRLKALLKTRSTVSSGLLLSTKSHLIVEGYKVDLV